jgi:hypothetical protein
MRLIEFQTRFQAAVVQPILGAEDRTLAIKTTNTGHYRIAIHQRHFWSRMHDFAAYRYPLLARWLGESEFDQLVRQYIAARPSTAYVAGDVVDELARFLAHTAPWSHWPIVAELACFDYVRSGLRLQADERAVAPDILAAMRPDVLARTRLRLKRRAALHVTHYHFQPSQLDLLARDTALDDQPVYWVLHLDTRGIVCRELEPRIYDALGLLAEGRTLRELLVELSQRHFDATEIARFVERCLRAELLVATQESP